MLILVVDDEENLCELVAEILSEKYEVIKTYNGKEAWQLVKQYSPDLVVSDIMMPEMSGLELLQQVKNDPATRSTPFILLSAAAKPDNSQEATAFLKKPFDIEELEEIVHQALGSSAQVSNQPASERKYPWSEAPKSQNLFRLSPPLSDCL